jgi:hypothetical protein
MFRPCNRAMKVQETPRAVGIALNMVCIAQATAGA